MVQLTENNLVDLEYHKKGDDVNSTVLWIYYKNITDVKANVFDKYKSLTKLYLWSLQLTKIPRGLLRHLSELEICDLQENKFKTIDADIFAGNPKLTTISLNNNIIEHLPPGVFDNLPELETLSLHQNKLTSFDFNSLKDSPKLTNLSLNSNSLEEILNFDLHKTLWRNLAELNLKQNKIPCVQGLRDGSDPHIVRLDEATVEQRKLCETKKIKALEEATKEKVKQLEAAKDEKKLLLLDLEAKNIKLEETERGLAREVEKAQKLAIERDALLEEKKQWILEMEQQKTKCERDLLAEREKAKKGTNEGKLIMDLSNILGNFQDLVINELNKKLGNLTIRIVDQEKIECVVPVDDVNNGQ